jgi:hypothetical protein
VAWVSDWMWTTGAIPLLTFGLLLFPDGHLPSPRWRPVAWLAPPAAVRSWRSPVLASEGRRPTRNRRVAVRHVATRRFLGVLGCKQPRAVGAGKRGLGQPARHNASAATGAARGCWGRLATDSDRQSARPVPVGGQAYSYARCSGSISWPPGRWQPPDPALVRPFDATACWPARHPRCLLLAC